MVDPAHLRKNALAPPVLVEEVLVNRAPVDLARHREVAPGSKDFAFLYTALSFTTPEKVRFKYRLEGFDHDWVDAGTRRVAHYTNLAPGAYRFRVIAANDDGVWNEEGAAVAFDLVPRFYQTAPFFVLVCTGIFVAGAGAVRLRVRQLRARARELEQRVEERTLQLATTFELLREKDERLNEDLLRAQAFQRRILPQLPEDQDIRFSAVYRPADLVGGDIYDVCSLGPGRFRVLVADTTGHGIQASLRTMVLKTEYDRIKLAARGPGGGARRAQSKRHHGVSKPRICAAARAASTSRKCPMEAWPSATPAPRILRFCTYGGAESRRSRTAARSSASRRTRASRRRSFGSSAETCSSPTRTGSTSRKMRGVPRSDWERIEGVLLATRGHASDAARAVEAAFSEFSAGCEMDDDVLLLCVEFSALARVRARRGNTSPRWTSTRPAGNGYLYGKRRAYALFSSSLRSSAAPAPAPRAPR